MNEDGTNVRRLTNGPGSSVDGRFSPDGRKIVFASDRSGDWYVCTMNADGTDAQQQAPAGSWSAPDWSPDGSLIVYQCRPTGICVMNADGTNIRQLTSTDDMFPRWSHDGRRIAFQSLRDGQWEVYVMSADGSNQTNLTRDPSTADWQPDWSPDDSKIAFTRWTEAYHDYVYVMNTDGTGAHPITGNEHNEHPVWSPDGARIAFNSGRGGRLRNVYVMGADESNPTRLTDRDDWATDWRVPTNIISIVEGWQLVDLRDERRRDRADKPRQEPSG